MDHLGHIFNMLSKEVRVAVEYADQALEELVGFLNAEVGKRRWVLVMTADHGMGVPADPTGAWPIGMDPLQSWIAEHVGLEVDELFAIRKPHGFWFNRDVLKANGITLEDIAELVLDYRLRDNATDIEDVPDDYRHRLDELLFTAAIPTHEMERVWRCAKRRASRS